jgi:hypothetical protein
MKTFSMLHFGFIIAIAVIFCAVFLMTITQGFKSNTRELKTQWKYKHCEK